MINFKTKVIAIVLVVSVVVAVGIYFGFKNFYFLRAPAEISGEPAQKIQPPSEIAKPESPKPSLSEIKPPASQIFPGFKLYKNAEFGFEIQYPESFIATEEINENVRGEMVKEFYFKKPNGDSRFAILPRDGLSYGIGVQGTSTQVFVGGSPGVGTQYVLEDGRRLWLLFPQYGLNNWLQDLGRIDAMTSIEDPTGDTQIFEQMLNSFKLIK